MKPSQKCSRCGIPFAGNTTCLLGQSSCLAALVAYCSTLLSDKPRRILSLATDPEQPDPEPEEVFKQLAEVDAGFLAWEFGLKSDKGDEIAFVSRSFRGFGREAGLFCSVRSLERIVNMPLA